VNNIGRDSLYTYSTCLLICLRILSAAIVESFTLIISPVLANILYSRFVATAPWVVYLTFGTITGVSALLSLFIRIRPLQSVSLDLQT
jgi:uncharacterized membrane protein YjjB (DUF3815 family)